MVKYTYLHTSTCKVTVCLTRVLAHQVMHIIDDIMADRSRKDGREGHGTGDGSGVSIVDRN